MTETRKGTLTAHWAAGDLTVAVQYNPKELTFDRSVTYGEAAVPGLDAPLLQFVRGQNETLTLVLLFDTTEEGMGKGATSVTKRTDPIYALSKIDPETHAPPIVEFAWNQEAFPGAHVTGIESEVMQQSVPLPTANQARNVFKGVVQQVQQTFTLFSPEGVPLRATLTLTLREFKPLHEQLQQLSLSSPDRTHAHIVEAGERITAIAERYYRRPGTWRPIADANGIDDPRRLSPGRALLVPPIR